MKCAAMASVKPIRLKSDFRRAVGNWLENIHDEVSKTSPNVSRVLTKISCDFSKIGGKAKAIF